MILLFLCMFICCVLFSFFFFFNDTATTEIYTLSLHDALPIWSGRWTPREPTYPAVMLRPPVICRSTFKFHCSLYARSEEHTSELQSPCNLVCRLLLEKKKKKRITLYINHNTHCLTICALVLSL